MPSITLSVHLHQDLQIIQLPREKVLSYQDLIRYIEFVYKDITVDDYDMYINDKHLIYNNDTLFDTLNGMNYNHIDLYLRLNNGSLKKNNIPVIKPTVLRWTANMDNLRNNHYPSMTNENNKRTSEEIEENDTYCNRKDSGISLSEDHEKQMKEEDENQQLKKKQRVMSADQSILSRQLPQLSPPSKYNTLNNMNHHHYNHHHSIHPLEMRRPSTAPSSPSYSRLLNSPSPVNIKLPALSSITSSPSLSSSTMVSSPSSILDNDPLFHTQLAPLQPSTSSSSPQKSYYYYSHPHSSILTNTTSATNNSMNTTTTTTITNNNNSNSDNNINLLQVSTNMNKKSQQKQQSGQFLCEHVLDTTSGRICGQTFRRSYDLSRHQTIHLKNRPFCYCDQCGKKFTRMDALRRHERVQGHTSKQHILHRPNNSNSSQNNNNNIVSISSSLSSSTTSNSSSLSSSQQHILSFINNPRTIQQTRV
ncbi:unnamed protein product [Cunninghamella blakesleeana]